MFEYIIKLSGSDIGNAMENAAETDWFDFLYALNDPSVMMNNISSAMDHDHRWWAEIVSAMKPDARKTMIEMFSNVKDN